MTFLCLNPLIWIATRRIEMERRALYREMLEHMRRPQAEEMLREMRSAAGVRNCRRCLRVTEEEKGRILARIDDMMEGAWEDPIPDEIARESYTLMREAFELSRWECPLRIDSGPACSTNVPRRSGRFRWSLCLWRTERDFTRRFSSALRREMTL
jgi:hypothetical protein